MKLHLSTELRRAVLACLAAFALPTTIAAASGTAALVCLPLGVNAEFPTADMVRPAAPVVLNFPGISPMKSASFDVFANPALSEGDAAFGQPGFGDGFPFAIPGQGAFSVNDVPEIPAPCDDTGTTDVPRSTDWVASDILERIGGDVRDIDYGAADSSGAAIVSGFSVIAAGESLDVSQTPSLTLNEDTIYGSITGEGTLEITSDAAEGTPKTLTLTNGGESFAGGITCGNPNVTVAFGGTLALGKHTTLSGTLQALDGASLTISEPVEVGQITGTLSALTLTGSGGLTINGGYGDPNPNFVGSLSVNTLTIADAGCMFMINVTPKSGTNVGGKISINTIIWPTTGEGMEGMGDLMIMVYGITDAMLASGGYQLFTHWDSSWYDHLTLMGNVNDDMSGEALQINPENGKIYAVVPKDVVWKADAEDELTWTTGEDQSGWEPWKDPETQETTPGQFINDANVLMGATAQGTKTVRVEGVTVGNLTVEGEGSTYAFVHNPDYPGGTVDVVGVFTVGNECTASFEGKMELIFEAGSSIVLGDGAELYVTGVKNPHDTTDNVGWENKHEDEGGKRLQITHSGGSGVGTLTIDMTYDNAGETFDGSTIDFGEGIKLHIIGGDGRRNVKNLRTISELELTGEGIFLEGSNSIGTLTVDGGTTLNFDNSGESASLNIGNVNLKSGTLRLDSTVSADTIKGKLQFNGGNFVWDRGETLSIGGIIGGDGKLQVKYGAGELRIKITGEGEESVSGIVNLEITGVPGDFMDTLQNEPYQVFDVTGTWNGAWAELFNVTVEGIEPEDGTFGIDEKGALVWKAGSKDLYWGTADGGDGLVWGGNAADFDQLPEGGGKEAWRDGKNVHFVGDGEAEHTVKLAEDIKTGNFEVQGDFLFTSDNNTTRKLVIGGDSMIVTGAGLTFDAKVDLMVDSNVVLELKSSRLDVAGTAAFNGKVVGDAQSVIAVSNTGTITITGSITDFAGTLDTGKGTITLSGAATSGDVGVTVGGGGTLAVESGDSGTKFTGVVSGNGLTLKNTGRGELLVLSSNSGIGTRLDGGTGGITLGDADNAITWNGTEVSGGTVTLANVTLSGGLTKNAGVINVDTAASGVVRTVAQDASVPTGGVVDVNGMNAEQLNNITINPGGQLRNVNGTYKAGIDDNHKLTLKFSVANVGTAPDPASGKYALIEGREGFVLDASSGDKGNITLDVNDVIADISEALHESQDATVYLHLLRGGTMEMGNFSVDDLVGHDILSTLAKQFSAAVEGGNIKLTGALEDVFVVPEKLNGAVDAAMLKNMKAVVVGTGKSVSFTTDGDAKLPNVLGGRGSSMTLQKSEKAAGRVTFTFDNSVADVAEVNPPYPEFGGNTVEGMDTTFLGRITADEGVNIAKTGEGTLTVGDNFTVSDGETRIEEGSLRLLGEQNEMKGGLVFAYETDSVEGKERGLLLENGMTEIGGMTDDGSKGAEVRLSGGAELTLTGESTLANTEMIGGEGGGTLYLEKGADLTFTGDKGITGVGVEMEDAVLDLGTSKSTLPAWNGTGTLKTAEGGELTVSGGTFTGTLESSGKGAGTLAVAEGATFTLDKVTSSAGTGVRLGAGSTLNVNVGDGTLKFGNVDLGNGLLKVNYGDKGIDGSVAGNITGWGESGVLEFRSNGAVSNGTIGTGFTLDKDLPTDPEILGQHFRFTGLGNFLKDHHLAVNSKNGEVELTTTDATENKFERELPSGAGKNAHAGAAMLWESLQDIKPEEAFTEMFTNPSSDYAKLVASLVQDIDNGTTAGLGRTLSAAAGSAISTLAPALSQDIHRQLTAIRNRTTTMASDSLTDGYDELPLWHAWLNAEGAYHKLDADGLAPGFTLHNWGGTVGVDVDISRTTTMGLAITAMYGDLEPDSADSASGDMDTYYLSAFARLAHGAWIHTLVVSGGIADVNLNRTVSHGGGSYRTDGSTDGCAFGAMYEVGYTGFINKRGTVALQPIANVELRHVELSGYTETGSDAGVDADDMDMTVLTLGVGARVQAAVSANAFNRSTVLEGRLLVKTDIGDRSGTVENAIVKHASRAEVESAEVGAVGVEAGIGISIPIDAQSGSIFADASLEWRDNWVSTNATLGYRVNF